MFFGMEPIKAQDSEHSFIDLRACFVEIKNDSLSIEIGTSGIPDSLNFNNPLIKKGFAEYALSIVFRNQNDTTAPNNLVFTICYENYNKARGQIFNSFENFLSQCETSFHHEKHDTIDGALHLSHENPLANHSDEIRWFNDSASINVRLPKELLCDYYDLYFTHGFLVKTCYNSPLNPDENNYITRTLSSDNWVRHNFLYNSSRRIE